MIVTINGVRVFTPECPKCHSDTGVMTNPDGFVYRCQKCNYELTLDDVLAYEKRIDGSIYYYGDDEE